MVGRRVVVHALFRVLVSSWCDPGPDARRRHGRAVGCRTATWCFMLESYSDLPGTASKPFGGCRRRFTPSPDGEPRVLIGFFLGSDWAACSG
jgi:hypothetical protein